MFLRCTRRFKDGKDHRYWNVVENKRTNGGRIVQRQVLYLGEINDSQQKVWRRTIEVLEDGTPHPVQMSLFSDDIPISKEEINVVQVILSELEVKKSPSVGRLLAILRTLGKFTS